MRRGIRMHGVVPVATAGVVGLTVNGRPPRLDSGGNSKNIYCRYFGQPRGPDC